MDGLAHLGELAGGGFEVFARVAEQTLSVSGGFGAALRQAAHLARDHGKTEPGLTGARGFHGGIQGEQVGLKGDFVDRLDHVRRPFTCGD